jgi:hypothetical protein
MRYKLKRQSLFETHNNIYLRVANRKKSEEEEEEEERYVN